MAGRGSRFGTVGFTLLALFVAVSPGGAYGAELVGWWSFDEAAGSAAQDSSSYGNSGTVYSAARVQGRIGGALSFDGHASYVRVPAMSQYDMTDAVSVEAWIRMSPTQFCAQPSVFDKSHRGLVALPRWTGYTIQAAPGGSQVVNFVALNGSAAPEVGSVVPLNDDSWHFVAGTASTGDGVMRFYVDGKMTQQIPFTGPVALNDGDVFIGRWWGAEGRYFAGLIDEVKVYHGALTPAEVADHYFDGSGSELVGWWAFDESSGDAIQDGSAYANPGTINYAARVAGIRGGALSFDGQTAYVQIPHAAQYDVADAVSVEAWIRMSPTQHYDQPNIFDKSHRFWSGYTLQGAQGGGMAVNFVAMADGGAPEVSSVAPLNDDRWHFVTGTASTHAGVMRFYVDGALTQEIPFAGPIGVNDGDILIGRFWGWQERYFAGLIDEVKVFRGALTPDDVQAHWIAYGYAAGVGDAPSAGRAVLHPCVPNPFNPRTTIKYDLPEAGAVRLAVYDLAGRLVRTLADESMTPGSREAVWDGRDASGREVGSGAYLARLEFGGRVETVRMGLVR